MRGRFFGALSFAVFLAVLWLSVCSHSHLNAGGRLRQHAMGAFRHHPSSTLGSFVLEPRNLALRGGSQELDPPGCVEEEDEEENTSDGSDAEGASEGGREENDVPENAPASCPGTSSEKAGKEDGCAGCPNQKACASGKGDEEDPDMLGIRDRMANVKQKLLVLSGKGGVGKSTVAAQLALSLSSQGFETGLLDIDVCGPSVPRMVGVESEEVRQAASGWQPVWVRENLCVMSIGFMLPSRDDAVVWRGVRKNGLVKQFLKDVDWGSLDFLIIDAPPGTSDEHITVAQALKHTENVAAVIVTTPQEMALLDVRKELSFCVKASCRVVGVVENMAGFVCPHCNCTSDIFPPSPEEFSAQPTAGSAQLTAPLQGGEGVAMKFGVPFLGRIPLDPRLSVACERGVISPHAVARLCVVSDLTHPETARASRKVSTKRTATRQRQRR